VDNLFNDIVEISDKLLNKPISIYERFLLDELLEIETKVVGIYGSRGVGKTTMLFQLAKKLPYKKDEIVYISCDYPYFSELSLFELVKYFEKYGIKCFLIDEIHEAKDFQKELKLIYDMFDVKVFFTGSSAIKITDASFARRYVLKKLPVLSFREFCELKLDVSLKSYTLEEILKNHRNISNEMIQSFDEKILKLFREYLKVGAYPFYFEDNKNFLTKLNHNVNTTFYNDIALLYNVPASKIITLKKLLLNICNSKPFELSMEKLSKIAGISKATLYKYIEYLHKAELLTHITYEAKRFKNMQKSDKLYLANPTLFNIFCSHGEIGSIRESFFISQLISFYSIYYVNKGDFLVDETYTFEIGGAKKSFNQIKDVKNSFVVADDIEVGFGAKIPLWLFGFLY
jgi:predicted AAA+ superfamily ATPase